MRIRTKALVIAPLGILLLIAGLYSFHRYQFPYGASHCCDIGLWFSLRNYAETHNGHFPFGEATPEASLSLLYRSRLEDAAILRGKTVPESVVKAILERGELLGPDTCGWHYVEGLTLADDPRLALFWDKAGLGHNGQRLSNGDRNVGLIRNPHEWIPGEKWSEFLHEQEKLWAARSKDAKQAKPLLIAKVRLPNGKIVDEYDSQYTFTYTHRDNSGSGSGQSGGNKLSSTSLRWWQLAEFGMGGTQNGTLNLSLTLGQWHSRLVQINISDGIVSPNSFVFELTETNTKQP